MERAVFAYIVAPPKDAERIARHLLDKRLIACANLIPIRSIYRWGGEVKNEEEVVLIGKTTEDRYAAVEREVLGIHPYETPCVTKILAEPNRAYLDWLVRDTR